MSKKKKASRPHSLPKRIVGVKVPKSVRRAADSPLGSALLAQAIIGVGKEAVSSPMVQRAVTDMRVTMARAAMGMAANMQDAAQRASEQRGPGPQDQRMSEPMDDRGGRRRGSSRRMSEDEMAY
jgi:hypothetical protein